MSSNERLARAVSGSCLVEYDKQTELVYAWNGSLTVNVYNLDGEPLDVFTLGLSDGRDVTVEYVERAIQERMAEDRGETAENPHDWQQGRFTGAVMCSRCGLLPLDDEDYASECEPV